MALLLKAECHSYTNEKMFVPERVNAKKKKKKKIYVFFFYFILVTKIDHENY